MRQTSELLELLYYLNSGGYNYIMRNGFIEIIIDNNLTGLNKVVHLNSKGVL